MSAPVSTFINPTTATTYRNVVTGDRWRITKSRDDQGQLRLAHLRGRVGLEAVDVEAVARLVAGTSGTSGRSTDPAATFAAVILCDLESTADVLTALARQAHQVCEAGCRGFRPRSPALQRQRASAMAEAIAACQHMAAAWQASHLVVDRALPNWLVAALADAGKQV